MAVDPGSTWAPLPEAGLPDGHAKTQAVIHSTGTRATAAQNRAFFARTDIVTESTFIVGREPSDPTLQIMDSTDRADANLTANVRAISIEVVGTGDDDYTPWQVAELIRLGRWAAATHGIPRRVCPAHDAPGFGWHVMFGAPGPWTSVRGKVCPGALRIRRLRETIFPAIFAATQPPAPAPPEPEEFDMYRIRVVEDKTIHLVTPVAVRALARAEEATAFDHLPLIERNRAQLDATRHVVVNNPLLAALAASPTSDPGKVAELVLAGLGPEAIARAIPDDLADRVIDSLGSRLGRSQG